MVPKGVQQVSLSLFLLIETVIGAGGGDVVGFVTKGKEEEKEKRMKKRMEKQRMEVKREQVVCYLQRRLCDLQLHPLLGCKHALTLHLYPRMETILVLVLVLVPCLKHAHCRPLHIEQCAQTCRCLHFEVDCFLKLRWMDYGRPPLH